MTLVADLDEAAQLLREMIDGGDECRGLDTRITLAALACERAARELTKMTAPLSPVEEDAELIERVARAIWLVGKDWNVRKSFDEMPEYGQDFHRDQARAALQALPRYGEMKAECDAATKLATLFKALLDDANAEARELRGLLASIADDACSLGCPSYQPPGAPPLTHTERCIAVRAALNNGEEE